MVCTNVAAGWKGRMWSGRDEVGRSELIVMDAISSCGKGRRVGDAGRCQRGKEKGKKVGGCIDEEVHTCACGCSVPICLQGHARPGESSESAWEQRQQQQQQQPWAYHTISSHHALYDGRDVAIAECEPFLCEAVAPVDGEHARDGSCNGVVMLRHLLHGGAPLLLCNEWRRRRRRESKSSQSRNWSRFRRSP